MSMETLTSDFYSGELSREEYERNGIEFEPKQELQQELDREEIRVIEAQEETFTFHVGIKNEDGYFEENREIRALDRREAERILERELDGYECEYTYGLI